MYVCVIFNITLHVYDTHMFIIYLGWLCLTSMFHIHPKDVCLLAYSNYTVFNKQKYVFGLKKSCACLVRHAKCFALIRHITLKGVSVCFGYLLLGASTFKSCAKLEIGSNCLESANQQRNTTSVTLPMKASSLKSIRYS